MPFLFCIPVLLGGSTMSVITCSGNVGFSGSIGVPGLNTLAASVLNSSVTLCASLVGGMPRLDKSIRSNTDVGSCCVLLLGVLVIAGVSAGVVHLLKGDVIPGLGPLPIMHQ